MSERDVARLRDLLGPIGKSLRLDDAASVGALWRRWPEIVGDDVARHAEPSSLKDGVLRVRATTPVWATEISYLVEDIKRRVNETLKKPLVREVRVWTSPEPINARVRSSEGGSSEHAPQGKPVRSDDPETAFRRAFQAWSKRRAKRPR